MVRTVDSAGRKRAILAAAINKYISDAVPVASDEIAEFFDLSPATIRHIFAELERDGYLTHLYTSGGRIPTNKGYRYYVDFLISQIELLDKEKEGIVREYHKKIHGLEEVLEKTSEVVSVLTHYTTIVSILDWQDRLFLKGIGFILEQPEFKDFSRIHFLIKMLEEKRQLLDIINRDFEEGNNVKVYIGEELSCPGMDNCSLAVSRYNINKKPTGRLAVLGPMRMEYGRIITTLEYVSGVLTEVLDEF